MEEEWDIIVTAQNLAIIESVKQDLITLQHLKDLRINQAKDAADLEMKRRLTAYAEALGILIKQIQEILDYPR